jgi:nucleotide-binding universal stress UspA family protein
MSGLTALIPLDTSEHSESSFLLLPVLKTLGFEKIRLLCVWDEQRKRPQRKNAQDYGGKKWGPEYLEAYLSDQATKAAALGYEVVTEIRTGKADEACLAAAAEPDIDLVLVATHGRTGIARLRLGSVANKIIKDSPCPVLVVGPNIEIDLTTYSLKRILVPLDGSELAELSLPIARYLASVTGAEIDLVRAVSASLAVHEPMMASVDLLSIVVDEATKYLERISQSLEGHTVNSYVVTGNAAEAILKHLKTHPVDLVIMASRGRTGVGRLTMGSVAERALQGPDPVLVFEPNEDRGRFFETARAAAKPSATPL